MNIPFRIKINFQIVFLCGIFGLLLLMFGCYLGFILLPDIVKQKVYETKRFQRDTEQWDMFMRSPFPSYFKLHLFNVENHRDVLKGAKPIVTDRGPYVYKIYRWKEEVVWNETAGEISYYEYDRYIFDQEASGKLSDNDLVTVLNTPYLIFIYKSETIEALKAFVRLINNALKHVFAENNGLFLVNVTVKDFLFDGIRMCKDGCDKDGYVARFICSYITSQLPSLKQMRLDGKDILYATFHYKNDTTLGHCTIDSGENDRMKTGELLRMNNMTSNNVWLDDKYYCNKIHGITTVFPINVDKNYRFASYSDEICRSIELEYSGTEIVDGIKGYRYAALKTTFNNSRVENRCYCVKETQDLDGTLRCLGDGILDMTECQGVPVLLSFPHLMYAEAKYTNSVEGLEPTVSKHETYVTLEPITGIPLRASKRVQFSMFLRPMESIVTTRRVRMSLIPMFWLEETFILPKIYRDQIKTTLLRGLLIVDIIKYSLISIALATVVACVLLFLYAK